MAKREKRRGASKIHGIQRYYIDIEEDSLGFSEIVETPDSLGKWVMYEDVEEAVADDAETLRRVREYANKLIRNRGTVGEVVAQEFLAILNGTERKETKR